MKEIKKAYWKTPAGLVLCNAMHSEGQEAIDKIRAIRNTLANALQQTDDSEVRPILENALKKIEAVRTAYLCLELSLNKEGF